MNVPDWVRTTSQSRRRGAAAARAGVRQHPGGRQGDRPAGRARDGCPLAAPDRAAGAGGHQQDDEVEAGDNGNAGIVKYLAQQHRLASKVEENPPKYHSDSNRVDVSFKVEPGPVVIVRTTGARLSRIPFMSARQMKKLIPIFSEGAIDPDLVQEGQRISQTISRRRAFSTPA